MYKIVHLAKFKYRTGYAKYSLQVFIWKISQEGAKLEFVEVLGGGGKAMSDSMKCRGVWGSSPRQILEFRSSEIDSDVI